MAFTNRNQGLGFYMKMVVVLATASIMASNAIEHLGEGVLSVIALAIGLAFLLISELHVAKHVELKGS